MFLGYQTYFIPLESTLNSNADRILAVATVWRQDLVSMVSLLDNRSASNNSSHVPGFMGRTMQADQCPVGPRARELMLGP